MLSSGDSKVVVIFVKSACFLWTPIIRIDMRVLDIGQLQAFNLLGVLGVDKLICEVVLHMLQTIVIDYVCLSRIVYIYLKFGVGLFTFRLFIAIY